MTLAIDIEAGLIEWCVHSPSHPIERRLVPNPFADGTLQAQLEVLRKQMSKPIEIATPDGVIAERVLLETARSIGERLTELILTPTYRDVLTVNAAAAGVGRARLTVAVHPVSASGEDAEVAARRADAALALPWELVMPEVGAFAVREGKLDVVREAVVLGAEGLPEPDERLSVAVHIAAPEGQSALRYEEESWRLMGSLHGHDVRFSDLGGRSDLLDLVSDDDTPTVVHFSGHGFTGGLVFEDDFGGADLVTINDLASSMRIKLAREAMTRLPPRLFYLASCFGSDSAPATVNESNTSGAGMRDGRLIADAALGRGPSTAATLHRCGFSQVVAYLGPVGDALSTRAEEVFYRVLAKGETTLQAVAEARDAMRADVVVEGVKVRHPLAWAQLALYHRGEDRPLSKPTPTSPRPLGRFTRKSVMMHGLPVLEVGFIGRRRHLHEVRDMVQRKGRRLVVIQGLGGLGKTALATRLLETVLAHASADRFIFDCKVAGDDPAGAMLVRAEEHGRIHGFARWDDVCKALAERHVQTVARLEATVGALRRERPGLVVYADNAESLQRGPDGDDPDALGEWRREAESWWAAMERLASEGVVMLSTRYRWPGLDPESLVAIGSMTQADTLKLIATWDRLGELPFEVQRRLSETVDGHPRTVEFLDKLVQRRQAKLGLKLDAIGDAWKQLIAPVLREGQKQITANLLLGDLWTGLSEDARAHAMVLRVLRGAAPDEVIRAVGDTEGLSAGALKAAGLLTRSTVDVGSGEKREVQERWGMHLVVVDFVRTKSTSATEADAHRAVGRAYVGWVKREGAVWADNIEAAHHLYAAGAPDEAWPLAERWVLALRRSALYAMAEAYLGVCEAAGTRGDALARLLTLRGQIRGYLGERSDAVLTIFREAAKDATSDTTRGAIHHELAGALRAQGRFAEAEAELRRSLEILRATVGDRHPSYAASLHSLAGALGAQGRLAEAEAELRHSLDIQKATVGERHPDYAASLHELAGALHAQGRFAEAEAALRRSLDIKKATVGERHPDYAASLHELAGVLRAQGRFAEAEDVLRRSLDTLRAIVGERHPNYGASLHSLAGMLRAQGRFAEAEAALQRSLDIKKATVGERHPDYAASLHELAGVLRAQGRFAEAEAALRRSLDTLRAIVGEQHPDYGASLHSLAGMLRAQGRFAEAEAALRRSLDIKKAIVGERHPDYAASLHELAGVLRAQGRFAEAEAALRRSLDIKKATVGEQHPDYAASLHELAGGLHAQGRLAEAEAELRRSLTINESVHGLHHPILAPTLINLAAVVAEQGRAAEGVPLAERALAIAIRTHGDHHPDVAQILNLQAQLLAGLGRPEARDAARRALSALEMTLGPDHPTTRNVRPVLNAIIEGTTAAPTSPAQSSLLALLESAHEAMRSRRFTEAVDEFRKALAAAHSLGEDLGIVSAAHGLAQALAFTGAHDEARPVAQEAETAATKTGNADAIRATRQLRATLSRTPTAVRPPSVDYDARFRAVEALVKTGKLDEARSELEALAAQAVSDEAIVPEASARGMLAQVLLMQGEHDGAEKEAKRALAIAEEVGDEGAQSNFRQLLAMIEAARTGRSPMGYAERLDAAVAAFQKREVEAAFDGVQSVIADAQAAKDRGGEFNGRLVLGQFLAAIGQPEVARIELRAALDIAQALNNAEAITAVRTVLERLPS